MANLRSPFQVKSFKSPNKLLVTSRSATEADQLSLTLRTPQHTGHPHPVMSSPTPQRPLWIFHHAVLTTASQRRDLFGYVAIMKPLFFAESTQSLGSRINPMSNPFVKCGRMRSLLRRVAPPCPARSGLRMPNTTASPLPVACHPRRCTPLDTAPTTSISTMPLCTPMPWRLPA
jgi:hypothetical protein